MSFPCRSMNKEESERVAVKPRLVMNVANRWNQARGACLSPYKDLFSRHTASGWSASVNPTGCWQRTCSCKWP